MSPYDSSRKGNHIEPCRFFAGTFIVERVTNFFGTLTYPLSQRTHFSPSRARWLVLILGSTLHAGFFVLMGTKTGYSTLLVAYALAAFARSFLTGATSAVSPSAAQQATSFIVVLHPSYRDSTFTTSRNAYLTAGPKPGALSYGFGFWSEYRSSPHAPSNRFAGLGAVVAPLVCQTIMATGVPWPKFYWGSLVLSAINFTALGYTFRPTPSETSREYKTTANLPSVDDLESHKSGDENLATPISEKSEDPFTGRLSPSIKKPAQRNSTHCSILTASSNIIQRSVLLSKCGISGTFLSSFSSIVDGMYLHLTPGAY